MYVYNELVKRNKLNKQHVNKRKVRLFIDNNKLYVVWKDTNNVREIVDTNDIFNIVSYNYITNLSFLKTKERLLSKVSITLNELNNIVTMVTLGNIQKCVFKLVKDIEEYISKKIILCKCEDIIYCAGYVIIKSEFDLEVVSEVQLTVLCKKLKLGSCVNLRYLYIDNLDIHLCNELYCFLTGWYSLQTCIIKGFDTTNIKNMKDAFRYCKCLENIDISCFDTSNCLDFSYMFSDCVSLKNLDLSNFSMRNARTVEGLLDGCKSLRFLETNWVFDNNIIENILFARYCPCLQNKPSYVIQ